MLDAFGKPGSDLMNYEIKWLGSFDECHAVKAVDHYNTSKGKTASHQYFSGKYCTISVDAGLGEVVCMSICFTISARTVSSGSTLFAFLYLFLITPTIMDLSEFSDGKVHDINSGCKGSTKHIDFKFLKWTLFGPWSWTHLGISFKYQSPYEALCR